MVGNNDSRNNFAQSVLSFLQKTKLDGIGELDYLELLNNFKYTFDYFQPLNIFLLFASIILSILYFLFFVTS